MRSFLLPGCAWNFERRIVTLAKKPARAKSAAKPASRAKKGAGSTKSKSNIAPSDDPDFILHSLQEEFEAAKSFAASDEQKLEFYRQMLLIRRFEEKAGQLYGLGLIGGRSDRRGVTCR